MKKSMYSGTILIVLSFFFLANSCIKKEKSSSFKQIELSGFFYKYLPYYLRLPKEMESHKLGIDSRHIDIETMDYDSTKKILRFSILQKAYAHLTVHDSTSNEAIKIKMRAVHPPITIHFISDGKEYTSGSRISKKELDAGAGFSCPLINFDVDFRAKMTRFNLIISEGGDFKSYPSNGARLSEVQKEALSKLNKNSIVVFNNMHLEGLGGDEIYPNPFVLFLKVD